ncbi:hypothetical protein [Hyphomicrobium sp. LHD-15]|uniref:hypothetical protein n=1 Tax=Hyphomicrobium sp. LHD-15 TaxID=3072142 RepID=UPI00280EEE96|nr:hypothetical protein [Hyphomicrobium sp. LHD-15]MDQ8700543.1 hypothetical protein [Hyphomicrobium sp. LHD-15]
MRTHSTSLVFAAAAIALGFATHHAALAAPPTATHLPMIAQAQDTAPESTEPQRAPPPDDQALTKPNTNQPVTAADIAECMKTWDADTGMTKAEYEKSCKRTLKYFPEEP